MTNLQMAQLSTTMSQAHRDTAFHFFTSNLNRTIEQWQKYFWCTCDHNPTIPFLILPRNNARTTWLLWVAVNLHFAIGIYTKSESGSLSFHDSYFSQSVKVFLYKSCTTAICASLRITWYFNMTVLVYNCVDKISVFEKYLWLAGQPGLFDTGMCAVPGNSHPASVVFVQFWKRGTGLSLSCETD